MPDDKPKKKSFLETAVGYLHDNPLTRALDKAAGKSDDKPADAPGYKRPKAPQKLEDISPKHKREKAEKDKAASKSAPRYKR